MSNYIDFMSKEQKIISVISNIHFEANSLIVSELKKYDITELAPSHGSILNALFYSKEKLRMNDIAEKINRDKSTVTALINKLVKNGYVIREKCSIDSRITFILLTDKGLKLKPIFESISEKLISTTYKDINQKEREYVVNLLEKILKNF